jgi:hypothetical protein
LKSILHNKNGLLKKSFLSNNLDKSHNDTERSFQSNGQGSPLVSPVRLTAQSPRITNNHPLKKLQLLLPEDKKEKIVQEYRKSVINQNQQKLLQSSNDSNDHEIRKQFNMLKEINSTFEKTRVTYIEESKEEAEDEIVKKTDRKNSRKLRPNKIMIIPETAYGVSKNKGKDGGMNRSVDYDMLERAYNKLNKGSPLFSTSLKQNSNEFNFTSDFDPNKSDMHFTAPFDIDLAVPEPDDGTANSAFFSCVPAPQGSAGAQSGNRGSLLEEMQRNKYMKSYGGRVNNNVRRKIKNIFRQDDSSEVPEFDSLPKTWRATKPNRKSMFMMDSFGAAEDPFTARASESRAAPKKIKKQKESLKLSKSCHMEITILSSKTPDEEHGCLKPCSGDAKCIIF